MSIDARRHQMKALKQISQRLPAFFLSLRFFRR
jgi:hypothetical protein